MNSIRVSPVSIAAASAADAHDRASSCSGSCSCSVISSSSTIVAVEPESIAIPVQRAKLARRVSFNLSENSVHHFPSNNAISKITQARSQKLSGISPPSSSNGSSNGRASNMVGEDALSGCEDFEELARVAERKAKSMLPQGASHDLLDPRFAMTALYVKNGHIRALERKPSSSLPLPLLASSANGNNSGDDHSSGDWAGPLPAALLSAAPPRGVLKPFAPSPIDASFFQGDGILGELTDEDDEFENDGSSGDLSQLLSPPQPHIHQQQQQQHPQQNGPSIRQHAPPKRGMSKKGGKRKKNRAKADRQSPASTDHGNAGDINHNYECVNIPSALPLPPSNTNISKNVILIM
ncbi:hypothetical protein IWW48_001095 [Coemansia sp. RSA 1200]|nr:hypothetical protein IWW48_001095 [Coemansia sp. RSA 1200]